MQRSQGGDMQRPSSPVHARGPPGSAAYHPTGAAQGVYEGLGGKEGLGSKGSSKVASNPNSNGNSNAASPTTGAATPANLPSPTALARDYFSLVKERNASLEIVDAAATLELTDGDIERIRLLFAEEDLNKDGVIDLDAMPEEEE